MNYISAIDSQFSPIWGSGRRACPASAGPRGLLAALSCMFLLLLSGCSPVQIYSDPALTKSTGFKYYTAKPYVQVEKDSQSGAIVKATVLYLPDLSNPQYVKVNGGLGSRKLDIELSDGTIKKFGLTSDTNIPESITALGNTISKTADAIKDLSTLKGLPQAGATTVTELYEVIMDAEGTILKKIEFK
ncbi:MAG TPA: hypothetical protein VHO68_12150 [Bacteroidales bacterium]|nr:hypothetical protein [Bacteroidales bacterium]